MRKTSYVVWPLCVAALILLIFATVGRLLDRSAEGPVEQYRFLDCPDCDRLPPVPERRK